MPTAPDTTDRAETARRARFGRLPRRIRPEEMIEEQPVSGPAGNSYDPDEWLVRNCW